MKTVIRISPFLSPHPSPWCEDKFARIKLTFYSLIEAGADDITILADSAESYKPYFRDYKWKDVSGFGNYGTYRELLKEAEKYDKVLVCEDDYLWRPGVFKQAEDFLDTENLLFPYDHPGHYTDGRFAIPWHLKKVGDYTYRECPSNTLTFFTHGQFIHDNIEVFGGYGIADHEMFTELRKRSPIWTPCYSMATHMVVDLLAPNVPWDEFAKMHSCELK